MSGATHEDRIPQDDENKAISETERNVSSLAQDSRNEPSHDVSTPQSPLEPVGPPSKAPHLVVVSEDAVNADGMGPRLRAAREALGMSLDDLAKSTRIRREYLLDIEEMYVKNLPGMPQSKSYLRGWVKAYARQVEMKDVDLIVDRYLRECGLADAPGPSVKSHASVETAVTGVAHARHEAARGKGGFIAGVATALVVIGALGAAVWFMGPWSGGEEAVRAPQSPAAKSAVADIVPAVPQFGAPIASIDLSLKAVKTSWIEVRGSDGTVYLSKQMLAGDVYVPRVGAGWTVTVQDGSAFEWRRDGVSLGLVDPDGGQVHATSVDVAAQREPVPEDALSERRDARR